jgi:hypothetical protein
LIRENEKKKGPKRTGSGQGSAGLAQLATCARGWPRSTRARAGQAATQACNGGAACDRPMRILRPMTVPSAMTRNRRRCRVPGDGGRSRRETGLTREGPGGDGEVVKTRRLEVALGTRSHGDVLPGVGEVVGARRWRRRRLGNAGGRA